MQHAEIENEGRLVRIVAQKVCAAFGHDRHTLAMGDVGNADQIQCIGKRIDHFPQIDIQQLGLFPNFGQQRGIHDLPHTKRGAT